MRRGKESADQIAVAPLDGSGFHSRRSSSTLFARLSRRRARALRSTDLRVDHKVAR